MSNIKFQLGLLYKVELFGTGYYKKLSAHFQKRLPRLAGMLGEMAEHEARHADMADGAFRELYGKRIGGKGFWLGMGSVSAVLQYPLPIKLTLKQASAVEKIAVKRIKKDLSGGEKNKYTDIIQKILPDEEKHANLYRDWVS